MAEDEDTLRPEYDFSQGMRGVTAQRYAQGANLVALIAADELAGWQETAHLLRSPNNARRLLEAGNRAAAGLGEAIHPDDLRQRLGLLKS